MMGLEPTTFCMASASDARARSQACAQTRLLPAFPTGRANASKPERTQNLAILATRWSDSVLSTVQSVGAILYRREAWSAMKPTVGSAS
jgi:hypothetical protein